MQQETTKQVPEEAAPITEEAAKQVRLNFNIDASRNERLRKLADYAAYDGLIPSHPRGNMTSFVNWCLEIGEDVLQKHWLKEKGF